MARPLKWFTGGAILIAVAWLVLGDLPIDAITREQVVDWVGQTGALGPVVIVLLMAVAIVFSPLPSAPIALASGALYGHYFGSLLVVAGAVIGAMAAFAISRYAGRDAVARWIGEDLHHIPWLQAAKSQNSLTAIVFFSRMIPFISFDAISWLAGLSPITSVRFFWATSFGILPMSFLLGHFGSELGSLESKAIAWAFVGLGSLFAAMIGWKALRSPKKKT